MRVISRALYIFVCILSQILFCLGAKEMMLPLAAAIFLHECAHLVILKLFGGKLKRFTPAPFGLCMEFDESTLSLGGEIAVSLGGCVINLVSMLASVLIYKFFGLDFLDFGIASLVLALVNLIPTEPLDGGRILFVSIAYFKGPCAASKITSIITYFFGFFVFLFASYTFLTAQSGIYPLLFSVYLFGRNSKMLEKATFYEKESI